MRFLVAEEGVEPAEPIDAATPGAAALAFCKAQDEDDPTWSEIDRNVVVLPDDDEARALPGWQSDEQDPKFRCFDGLSTIGDPGLWVVTRLNGPLKFRGGRRGARTSNLSAWPGETFFVWCETGGRPPWKPLTGEWRCARVETIGEQIARLERERDAARRALAENVKALARVFDLLNDQRPILRRLERSAQHPLDAHEAGVAEETIDMVIEELSAAAALAKGASQ